MYRKQVSSKIALKFMVLTVPVIRLKISKAVDSATCKNIIPKHSSEVNMYVKLYVFKAFIA